ncbi:MAG: hypothetical protein GY774_35905 [Planctomycetes bacterium]|nr:hypothetical protein [Planctomycetota bacterium]
MGFVFLLNKNPMDEGVSLNLRIFSALFACLFVFGIAAGLALTEWPRRGMQMSLIYQVLQIPIVTSPIISYIFVSGLRIFAGFKEGNGFVLTEFGTRVAIYVMREDPWSISINLLALVLSVYLLMQLRPKKKAVAPEEDTMMHLIDEQPQKNEA